MAGANKIRGAMFGGFNRTDVSDYVEKLARERNEYKKQCQTLQEQLQREKEKSDTVSLQSRETALRLAQSASETVSRLEEQYAAMRRELESTLGQLRQEMESGLAQLEKLEEALASSEDVFGEMHRLADSLSNEPEETEE